MKVLHVAETIKGGVATVMNELINHQENDSEFKKIITLVPKNQIDELICKEKSLTFNRTGRNFSSLFRLAVSFFKALISHKPDVIHLHSTFAGVICRVVLIFMPFTKKTVIYCPHAFSFIMVSSRAKQKIYVLIEKILQFKTCKIICVSKHELNEAIKFGLNSNKLELIYNGVNEKDNSSKSLILKRKNYDTEFNIVFVGRFDYQKGYDLLCDVIKRIDSNAKGNIKFTLVGGYVNENKNANHLSLSNVNNLGWISKQKVSVEYSNADLLVIPSRWEGFAMVPLEAFKAKLPILASDFPSFLEVVKDGSTGFVFENGSVDDLYLKIMHIYNLTDRDIVLKTIADAAYREFNDKFTSVTMFKKTKSLYKDCLSDFS